MRGQEEDILRLLLGNLHLQPQLFIFSVLWSDGNDSLIYRTFQEFRQFHKTLKDTFPLEAGLLKSSDCVLPKFQDALVLLPSGRTRKGLARLRLLEAYSQQLLRVTETVSQSEVVTGFFQPQPGDLEPVLPQNSLVIMPSPWERPEQSPKKPPALEPDIYNLEAQTFRCLDNFSTQDTRGRLFKAGAGEELDVLLKEPTGWWLVENEDRQIAWFPAPYLEEVSPREGCEEMPQTPCSGLPFCTTGAYVSSREDELSVPAGARVTVLQESECGWWQCRYLGRLGLLPAVLLCPDPVNASGLGMLLNATRANLDPEPSSGTEAEPEEGRLHPHPQPAPPTNLNSSSDSGSGSDNGESSAMAAPGSGPVVPARPRRGDILRSCCSVTRKALFRPVTRRSPVPTLDSGLEIPAPALPSAKPCLASPASYSSKLPGLDSQINSLDARL
ncbi:NADPH oxidase organizer 1 isoform X1 [Vombatus ursinus]|uniref:NADPH oxidase organizer 1 isoform X1 n=1 Tax=Vombatus ursinus TaxID=29139 RepID=UPI000FFCF71F|nr:NADPH oxidase organizer 1 isoform X1 [Vombatus ursinus]